MHFEDLKQVPLGYGLIQLVAELLTKWSTTRSEAIKSKDCSVHLKRLNRFLIETCRVTRTSIRRETETNKLDNESWQAFDILQLLDSSMS